MYPLQNLYDVVDILKDGKHGKVFLVYDKVGKQICVLKERSLQTAEIYRRLKNLQSPFVPKIYRTVQNGEKIFVVEEFIEGQTLAEILIYKNLDEKFATEILKQLCDGLKFLHSKKIIHRDIKPSNIMLTKNNSVKLIDFSISRIAKEHSESDTDFLGTRGYAPPEQFGFGQTDSRSDIFSLGKTFQKILGDNYNGYLKKILQKCTELDPAKRYQTVEEISADIDKKFFRHKLKNVLLKFIGTAAIIFSVLLFPENFFEDKLPEKNFSDERIVEPEVKKIPAEKSSEIQPETFQFPEIKIPEINSESPQKNLDLPKSQSEKIPSDPRLNQVCTLYLNNKIFNAEIPAEIWKNWRREGDIIYFPADWNLTLKAENKNNFALNDLKISITVDGEEKIFSATIPAGQSKNFSVPLTKLSDGKCKIKINLKCDKIFSWQGNSFGNYRELQIYLIGWRVRQ